MIFDEKKGIAFEGYNADLIHAFLVLVHYTDLDTSAFDTAEGRQELFDIIATHGLWEGIMEVVEDDLEDVDCISARLETSARRSFEHEHSLHFQVLKTFQSLLGTEDVTEFEEVPVYCRYLDPETIRRTGIWTPAQVQQKLEEASEKEAKEFVAFLRDYERKGYLCFHGESKRKIFQTLRQQLPMMRNYSEANFYAYF